MSNGNQPSGQGDFRGDFTRDTFDAAKRFSRVFMQQGRVQLDADWNEQTSIVLHYLRSLAADLIGQHGGPVNDFTVNTVDVDATHGTLTFNVTPGHYYVDGILCEAGDSFVIDAAGVTQDTNLVFLDVWERHVTSNEDPDISEVALGGPDTTTRAQVVCNLMVPTLTDDQRKELQTDVTAWDTAEGDAKADKEKTLRDFVDNVQKDLTLFTKPVLRARAKVAQPIEACHISPEAQYRGAENQLYRVEIHDGGAAWDGTMNTEKTQPVFTETTTATFKWSRDNGSVVFPVLTLKGDSVKLANLGRDHRRTLTIGDWVEVVDDDLASRGQPGKLRQITEVKTDEMTVTLSDEVGQTFDETSTTHPLLRRWDHSTSDGQPADGALLFKEAAGEEVGNWITLEDGVQIQFATSDAGALYHAGDYWLIPARVATGDVLWPKVESAGKQIAAGQTPHGVEHHYAPLAIIDVKDVNITVTLDLRRTFPPLAQ
jgi:hypothetical protein